jgi:hypothetical protein
MTTRRCSACDHVKSPDAFRPNGRDCRVCEFAALLESGADQHRRSREAAAYIQGFSDGQRAEREKAAAK